MEPATTIFESACTATLVSVTWLKSTAALRRARGSRGSQALDWRRPAMDEDIVSRARREWQGRFIRLNSFETGSHPGGFFSTAGRLAAILEALYQHGRGARATSRVKAKTKGAHVMPISVVCQNCGKTLKVKDEWMGKRATC